MSCYRLPKDVSTEIEKSQNLEFEIRGGEPSHVSFSGYFARVAFAAQVRNVCCNSVGLDFIGELHCHASWKVLNVLQSSTVNFLPTVFESLDVFQTYSQIWGRVAFHRKKSRSSCLIKCHSHQLDFVFISHHL